MRRILYNAVRIARLPVADNIGREQETSTPRRRTGRRSASLPLRMSALIPRGGPGQRVPRLNRDGVQHAVYGCVVALVIAAAGQPRQVVCRIGGNIEGIQCFRLRKERLMAAALIVQNRKQRAVRCNPLPGACVRRIL
jgi:hypothetical protein